jgi:hypothetical protein
MLSDISTCLAISSRRRQQNVNRDAISSNMYFGPQPSMRRLLCLFGRSAQQNFELKFTVASALSAAEIKT